MKETLWDLDTGNCIKTELTAGRTTSADWSYGATTTGSNATTRARAMAVESWLFDPDVWPVPSNMTFAEINDVLDDIEARISELRVLYPV